jgi:hypothetical protein
VRRMNDWELADLARRVARHAAYANGADVATTHVGGFSLPRRCASSCLDFEQGVRR